MRYVHIPADHHRLLLIQPFHIGAEGVLPFHAVINARQFALCIGRVHGHKIKIGEFEGDCAPFPFVLLRTDPILYRKRFQPGKDCRARVPFL